MLLYKNFAQYSERAEINLMLEGTQIKREIKKVSDLINILGTLN